MKHAFGTPKTVKEIDDIEQPFVDFAISRGWLCEKVISLSRNGWPDRCLIRKGRTVWCEFKAPGKKPTPQQAKRHREMEKYGAEVVWFDDLAEAMEFFR